MTISPEGRAALGRLGREISRQLRAELPLPERLSCDPLPYLPMRATRPVRPSMSGMPANALRVLVTRRVPPPGRVDFDHDRFRVAPQVAYALAERSPQPDYAMHLVQRAVRDDEGKPVLWKVSSSLLAAGLRQDMARAMGRRR